MSQLLKQGCQGYGPWVGAGPWSHIIWHPVLLVGLEVVHSLHVSWVGWPHELHAACAAASVSELRVCSCRHAQYSPAAALLHATAAPDSTVIQSCLGQPCQGHALHAVLPLWGCAARGRCFQVRVHMALTPECGAGADQPCTSHRARRVTWVWHPWFKTKPSWFFRLIIFVLLGRNKPKTQIFRVILHPIGMVMHGHTRTSMLQ